MQFMIRGLRNGRKESMWTRVQGKNFIGNEIENVEKFAESIK